MTIEEFQNKLNDLMMELNKDDERPYNIACFIYDVVDEEIYPMGMGCAACLGEVLVEKMNAGIIEHKKMSLTHRGEVH